VDWVARRVGEKAKVEEKEGGGEEQERESRRKEIEEKVRAAREVQEASAPAEVHHCHRCHSCGNCGRELVPAAQAEVEHEAKAGKGKANVVENIVEAVENKSAKGKHKGKSETKGKVIAKGQVTIPPNGMVRLDMGKLNKSKLNKLSMGSLELELVVQSVKEKFSADMKETTIEEDIQELRELLSNDTEGEVAPWVREGLAQVEEAVKMERDDKAADEETKTAETKTSESESAEAETVAPPHFGPKTEEQHWWARLRRIRHLEQRCLEARLVRCLQARLLWNRMERGRGGVFGGCPHLHGEEEEEEEMPAMEEA